ncbi:MAG: sigma-70 family RNA polymerase sigma factor [Planctomycetaceae bacterium]|nr:sigma-70 family RNA polymerase sigma factor [Planctomycetaceae bacterium]
MDFIDQNNDSSLLRRISKGDHAAAKEVFDRHAPGLFLAAKKRLSSVLNSRVDADDIVQSTFKSFFRRASNGGYAAPKSGDLFNLLIVIAMRKVNARADYHLASSRDVRKTSATAMSDDTDSPSTDMAVTELLMTIADLLEEFNELQREIITLRLEGYSVLEIADKCDRSKRTVERELQAFRIRLSQEFAP